MKMAKQEVVKQPRPVGMTEGSFPQNKVTATCSKCGAKNTLTIDPGSQGSKVCTFCGGNIEYDTKNLEEVQA